jgi:two-component system CheB/CheR fusion protein
MSPSLQQDVIARLHYALKPGGFLMLGASETIAGQRHLFRVEDRKNHICVKEPARGAVTSYYVDEVRGPARGRRGPERVVPQDGRLVEAAANRIIRRCGSPATVTVDRNLNIVRFHGRTGRYLEWPPGEPTCKLLRMVRQGLLHEVRTALGRALTTDEPVRCAPLTVTCNGSRQDVSLEVVPLPNTEHAVCSRKSAASVRTVRSVP